MTKTNELTTLIYDTLMKNTNYDQLDLEKVEAQELDQNQNKISFYYEMNEMSRVMPLLIFPFLFSF